MTNFVTVCPKCYAISHNEELIGKPCLFEDCDGIHIRADPSKEYPETRYD